MLRFTWTYDYARGGAVVSVTSSEGEVTELGLVNNGNVAQILCDALESVHTGGKFSTPTRRNDREDGAALSWLGYVNPPRPTSVLTPEEEDDNERRALKARGLY